MNPVNLRRLTEVLEAKLGQLSNGILASILLCICLLSFLPGFTTLPPIDRDEAKYAQASQQMLESRNFIDIRFHETARYKKPVGIYWLQAAATAIAGDSSTPKIWTFRIPSLLGATLAVFLTWAVGRRLFGNRAGFAAALILSCTFLLGVETRLAKTDAALLAAIIAAQLGAAECYWRTRSGRPVSWRVSLLFWVALGVGILIKGPVALLVCGSCILTLCLWDRSSKLFLALRPATGILVSAIIAAPWFVLITIVSGGAFFREAIGIDLLGKVYESQESHGAPPGYFLASFWIMFWPFALLAGPASVWAWRNRASPAVRFCIAWIIPTWILFELFVTKLPHYVLPTFPAIAILVAAAIADEQVWRGLRNRIWTWISMFLSLAGTIVIAAVSVGIPAAFGDYFSFWSTAVILAILVVVLLYFRLALIHRGAGQAILPLCAAGILLSAAIFGGILPATGALWIPSHVAEIVQNYRQSCPSAPLAVTGYNEPSLIFLTGTDTLIVSPASAAETLSSNPGCSLAVVNSGHESEFRLSLETVSLAPRLVAEIEGFNYSRFEYAVLKVFDLPNPGN